MRPMTRSKTGPPMPTARPAATVRRAATALMAAGARSATPVSGRNIRRRRTISTSATLPRRCRRSPVCRWPSAMPTGTRSVPWRTPAQATACRRLQTRAVRLRWIRQTRISSGCCTRSRAAAMRMRPIAQGIRTAASAQEAGARICVC